MEITVGTGNNVKISAVREIIADYDFLKDAPVKGIKTDSRVSKQPQSLGETVRGAKNRARAAFLGMDSAKGDLSVGIEDGLMEVSETLTGMVNICCCAVYDGKNYCLGFSAGFEYPPEAVRLVKKGLDINQAFYKMELTGNPQIGSSEGAIGILTKGRWSRKDTVKQALVSALIQIDNRGLYSN